MVSVIPKLSVFFAEIIKTWHSENSANNSKIQLAKQTLTLLIFFQLVLFKHQLKIWKLFILRCVISQQTFFLVKTYWRSLEDVLKTSWRRLARRLEDVLGRRIANMSWRRLQDVLEDEKCYAEDAFKTSWRRLGKQEMFAGML